MHFIPEFQAVVFAAGKGSRLPDVGGSVSKCLLPVGPYPVLWYPLNMLERIGFLDTMVIVLDEDKSNILNALEKCPLKIKYELIVIPSEEDWGTADSLKHINSRISTDILIIPGDIITNDNLSEFMNLHRRHDASLTALFFDSFDEWIELPGPKNKFKSDRDVTCIDEKTHRLMFLASISDFEDEVVFPRLMIKKFDSIIAYSKMLDGHVYIMKKWLINYLAESQKFTSIKGELIPFIIKKQLCKPKASVESEDCANTDVSNDIYSFAGDEISGNGCIKNISKHTYEYKDALTCYAHIPKQKNIFGLRVNNLSSFYLMNNKILSKWEELTGSPLNLKLHPSSVVKTKQIDDNSLVGENSVINEKTSIKSSFIGTNCLIENKVRISNCILMNNVTLKEGCTLQDCIVYIGATVETNCNLQHCLVGPHLLVASSTSGNHQLYSENMITLD